MADQKDDFKFEITKQVGVIGDGTHGWRKEVNFVSWNERQPKLDIRDWNETHEKMGKGVSLSGKESKALLSLLSSVDLDQLSD